MIRPLHDLILARRAVERGGLCLPDSVIDPTQVARVALQSAASVAEASTAHQPADQEAP